MEIELKDIIEEAGKTLSIRYISYENKLELNAEYFKAFGEQIDITCPRCIMSACVELYKLGRKKGVKNERRKK